jgi:hypothetical protein
VVKSIALTHSALPNDRRQTEEEHHAPDVEQTSHLEQKFVAAYLNC